MARRCDEPGAVVGGVDVRLHERVGGAEELLVDESAQLDGKVAEEGRLRLRVWLGVGLVGSGSRVVRWVIVLVWDDSCGS